MSAFETFARGKSFSGDICDSHERTSGSSEAALAICHHGAGLKRSSSLSVKDSREEKKNASLSQMKPRLVLDKRRSCGLTGSGGETQPRACAH